MAPTGAAGLPPVLTERASMLAAGVRTLALQSDLPGMAAVAAETTAEVGQAARGRCYFVDAEDGLLWTADGDEFPANHGLAGAAVSSGRVRLAPRARQCPLVRRELDDPDGSGTERLLALPITSANGETHAVVVIARSAAMPAFSPAEIEVLSLWADQIAPLFHMLHVEGQAEQLQRDAGMAGRRGIYREEALEGLAQGEPNFGVLLEPMPWWLRHAYLLVVLVFVTGGLFFALVDAREYASGPAFIVSTRGRDISAARAGVVDSVLVAPGQAVVRGQLLVTFAADPERAEMTRARAELDRTLLARLRTPSERTHELAVAQAQATWRRAEAQVEHANLRAPAAGHIGDVRIETGRALEAGQVVMTLADDDHPRPLVRALVPGRYRPALEVGQALTLALDGFPTAPQRLTVTSVSEQVVGTREIHRIVGPEIADALPAQGPMIIVEAELPADTIEADGRTWTLHEGMVGRADIAVRHQSVAHLLFPQLERILGDA
ncbi:MAG: HlyD family efflux transporter periplasmic adaptor subunit [Deltaproteobacteria bacterium]|nr:HlyD family efflux transporter periplasmic adaptor subunit [Deltaproteobacteria bacterium]